MTDLAHATPGPAAGAPRTAPRRAPAALLVALALALLSGCGGGDDSTAGDSGGGGAAGATTGHAPPAGADPGVAHVHGLGVDPADGVLYAATHFGLFRLPEQGEAVRVAGRMQDSMGFTVVGPRTFLGSGHPDPREPHLPPRLGLVRSTDAAETWQTVSLSGEVDFHALHTAHGRVHGWDAGSGRLMVSADGGHTWETRSTLGLRDFAVSPSRPDRLLATTERGLVRSTDGGRTWAAVPGAPVLVVLAWRPSGLSAVAPDGTVHHSADGGARWSRRGSVGGQPEALTVDDRGGTPTLYVAVRDRGILESRDGGATFTTRYEE